MIDRCRPDHPGRGLFTGSTSTNIARNKDGGIMGFSSEAYDRDVPVGGINLTTTPLLPAAHAALDAAELEERIREYQELAAAGKPLKPRQRQA